MSMAHRVVVACLAALAFVCAHLCHAQQTKTAYRIGVIHEGGSFYAIIDGLKAELKTLGLEEGKQYVLETRDLKSDRKAASEAAVILERGKVNLIYALSTSIATAVKQATAEVPIVFAVGADPVGAGLVESFAKPGGRLTGVHYLSADLTAKRLELLKAMLPDLRKAVTFYDPANRIAVESAESARDAARQLGIKIVERHVSSIGELRTSLQALKPEDADAYFYTNDAMVTSQGQLIIDTANSKKLPTMFSEPGFAAKGALAAYGVSYYEVGRLSAKYIQRIIAGTPPRDLPVESYRQTVFVVNVKTAREIGVAIPQAVLLRTDDVIR